MATLSKKKDVFYLREAVKVNGVWKGKWIKLGKIDLKTAKRALHKYHTDKTYLRIGFAGTHKITLREMVDVYFNHVKTLPNTKKEETLATEKRLLVRLCKDFGNVDISELSIIQLSQFFKTHNYKPNTIRLIKNYLNQVYKTAIELKYLDENPIKNLKVPTIEVGAPRHVDVKDLHKLFDALENDEKVAFQVMYYTGFRPSEAFRLKVSNINFKQKYISLDATQTKTSIARVAPLNNKLSKILKEYIKNKASEDYLFLGQYNKGHRKDWKRALTDANKKAETKITAYQIRHTFAYEALKRSGGDLRAVQELLGHKTITMTLRYTKTPESKLHAIVNKIK